MRRSISIGILLLSITNPAFANQDKENTDVIKEYPLDPKTVYNIPIGNTATTITFPGPLLSIDGANVSNTPGTNAPVLLSYVDGRHFFSVKAVQPNARAAVNVVYKNDTYAFNFYHREDSIPYRTVRLLNQEEPPLFPKALPHRPRVISKTTPPVLLSLLDRSKSHPLLNLFTDAGPDEAPVYRAPADLVTEYRDFDVRIDAIFRYGAYDTMVFKITLRNKSKEDIFYQPQTIAVRIGQNLYFPSIADASGIIPALSESTAFVAITGKPGGGPAHLSIKNHFKIVVSKVMDPAKLIIP